MRIWYIISQNLREKGFFVSDIVFLSNDYISSYQNDCHRKLVLTYNIISSKISNTIRNKRKNFMNIPFLYLFILYVYKCNLLTFISHNSHSITTLLHTNTETRCEITPLMLRHEPHHWAFKTQTSKLFAAPPLATSLPTPTRC